MPFVDITKVLYITHTHTHLLLSKVCKKSFPPAKKRSGETCLKWLLYCSTGGFLFCFKRWFKGKKKQNTEKVSEPAGTAWMFFSCCAEINLFSTTHLKPTKAGREYKAATVALTANRVATLESRFASGPKKKQQWRRQNGTDALEAVAGIALINILCWAPHRMEKRWREEKRGEKERQPGVKGWCINLNVRGWSSREQGLWCRGGSSSSSHSRLIRQRQHFQVGLVAVKKFKTGLIGHKIVIQESWASLCNPDCCILEGGVRAKCSNGVRRDLKALKGEK